MKSRTYKSLGEFFGLSAMIGANAPKRPKTRRVRRQTQADSDALTAAQAKRDRKAAKLQGNGK